MRRPRRRWRASLDTSWLGCGLLALAACVPAAAAELPFSSARYVFGSPAGSTPLGGSTYADIDGDGDLDFVGIDDFSAGTVSWFENTGSSWTQQPIDAIGTSFGQAALVAADLDGDADVDLAAGNLSALAWLENTAGDGSAWSIQSLGGSASAISIASADVDRDGDLDLVCATEITLLWYENTGAGFVEQLPFGVGHPKKVAVGDLDRDGDLDVAATFDQGDDRVAWYENDGQGDFGTQQSIATSLANADWLVAGDLDSDGDLDVAASHGTQNLSWFENTAGDASAWSGAQPVAAVSPPDAFGGLAQADLDADGDVDLVTSTDGNVAVTWHENTAGDGSAWTARPIASQAGGSVSRGAHAADFDGDGDTDVALTDPYFAWYENQSIHRSTAFFDETLVLTADQPRDVTTGDIDGDGDLDALAVEPASVAWLENTAGDGSAWATHTIAAGNHSHAVPVDLDRDGDLDVLVDGALGWYENSAGDGSAWTLHSIGFASSPALADFDGDGDLDVVGERGVSDDIRWYENTGQGLTWSAVNVIATGWTLVSTVRAADMDGDGDFDVLVSGPTTPPRAAWLENDGTPGGLGDWTEHTIATGSAASGTVPSEAVDLDRDGDLDLAIKIDGQLRWYANQDGTGTSWGAPVLVQATALGSTRNLAALDLDADGDSDLVKAGHDDRITWHENLSGDGTSWAERRVTGLAPTAGAVAAHDVDGDGDPDVLGASIDSDTIAWYENQGGQLALPTEDVSRSGGALAGTAEALLRIDAAHRGRSGDSAIQVTSLELLFEQAEGDPLSSAEANALVDELRVYQDDGSGSFDGSDTQIFSQTSLTLAGGLLALDVSSDADFVLAHGAPRTWFVVALLAADAASQSPSTLRVTHLTQATSAGEDASAGTPVTLEFAAADPAAVTALAPLADADADGLTNQTELDTESSDPFDADTDGDGLADGAEVNTHASDPLDSDSDDDGWLDGTEAALGSSPTVGGSLPTTPPKARLGPPQTIASGLTDADDLALADVDGDGDLDLIFKGSTAIVWRENAVGDGSIWTEHDILPAAPINQRQTVADFDRDGDLDVASLSATVRWHANTSGDGLSWSTSVVEITGVAGVAEGEAADLDRDGDADLVETLTRENRLKWYENQGGSSFVRSTITRVHWANSAVTGDIDRDGDLDVLTSAGDIPDAEPVEGQNQLAWHENLAGDASSWSTHVIESSVTRLGKAKLADLDGDGDLDALVLSGSPEGISWYENAGGDGSVWVERALDQRITSIPDSSWDVQAGDVDADGDLDVLVLAISELLWFENLAGDASTWAPRPLAFTTDNDLREIAVGDIDGDGDLDVAGAHEGAGIVFWSENLTIHRSAAFGTPNTIDAAPDLANWVLAGDVDRDGDQDALIINVGVTGGIRWRANTDGAGTFGPANLIASANHARVIRMADMDRDGDPDLVTAATLGTPGLAWRENTAGDASSWTTRTISATYPSPYHADVGDIDGDGDPDVFASNSPISGTSIAWFENTAGDASTWSEHFVASTQGVATDVRLADVDGDGDLDAFYNDINYARIAWKENTAGDGSAWADHVIDLTTTFPNTVEPVDLDRDGDVDVAVASRGSNNSAWFENANGAGTSWTRHSLGSPAKLSWLRAADLDLDGDVDVVGAAEEADDVIVFENVAGDGTSWTPRALDAGVEGTLGVEAADLDGDGDPDLLAAGFQVGAPNVDGPVVWLENGGGQFALPTASTAYQGMVESRARQVLAVDFAHRGRSGDSDAELAAIELRLEDSAGTPLTASEADNLFSQIQIRLGSPTGAVIATLAAPFGPSAGVITLPFADADPNVQLDPAQELQLYVVPTLTANASSAPKNQFQIEHVTESSSRAEDASADLPLSLEYEADTSSGVIQALSPVGDADSDGLTNAAEADTHLTDPGNADTDGDGAGDGLEVNTLGSNPLDTDSDDDGLQDGAEVAINTDPTSADSDSDGFCDGPLPVFGCAAGDNCPAISNAAQTNSDPLSAGDACQCGDVTGDGPLTAADYQRAREYVVNRSAGFFDAGSCDVNGDAGCDVEDLAVLDRAAAGVGTVVDACEAYTGP